MKKKFLKIGIVIYSIAGLLCGCNEKELDYNLAKDTMGDKNIVGTTFNLAQFADAERWTEDMKTTLDNGTSVNIQINAKITVPERNSMSVIEVKEPDFDNAYKEQVVKGVFGESEVYYYDDTHLPKTLLSEKIGEYEEEVAKRQQEINEVSMSENYQAQVKSEISEYEEKIADCERAFVTATDDYIPVTKYDSNVYLGYRNGAPYILRMEYRTDYNGLYFRNMEISLKPQNVYDICPKEMEKSKDMFFTEGYGGDESNNQCELNEQRARDLAEEALLDIGFSNPVFISSAPLQWLGDMEQIEEKTWKYNTSCVDGYCFSYEFGIDGLSITDYGNEKDYQDYYQNVEDVHEDPIYSMVAKAWNVCVTEEGVINIELQNPLEVTKITSGVELLSIENIQNIIRNELTEHLDQFSFYSKSTKNYNFSVMDLIYFRVPDDTKEGYYSYIPTWRLGCTDSYENYIYVVFINAIDGSIMYVE